MLQGRHTTGKTCMRGILEVSQIEEWGTPESHPKLSSYIEDV